MKYGFMAAAVTASTVFAISPASSKMSMCSSDHLTKMTTMIGGMPDGTHTVGDVQAFGDGELRYGQRRHTRMRKDDDEYASSHHMHHTGHMGHGKKM